MVGTITAIVVSIIVWIIFLEIRLFKYKEKDKEALQEVVRGLINTQTYHEIVKGHTKELIREVTITLLTLAVAIVLICLFV